MLFNNINNIKFCDLMNEWIDRHAMRIEGSTAYGYKKTIAYLCTLDISNKKIKDISTADLQKMYASFYASGKKPSTVITYNKVVKMSFDYAVLKKYLKNNPYQDITISRKILSEIEPFTAEEVNKLLKVPAREWFRDACEIAFRTGMRKGEIFGLKKDTINFDKKFMMVKHAQALNSSGKIVLSTPKTRTSRRRIDCDEETMRILRRRFDMNDSPFVFAYEDGSMLIPWSLSDTLKKKIKESGIKDHRFHDFRHGHATYLLINNVHPKIVQERLGHANIAITLDTYSHLVPGMQQTAVEALDKIKF